MIKIQKMPLKYGEAFNITFSYVQAYGRYPYSMFGQTVARPHY